MKKAELHYNGKIYDLPLIEGSENETAIDISNLRKEAGVITLDRGFKNTGSTKSAITFLNGEEGILRYRGYSIEELAEQSTFLEVAFLLIYVELLCIQISSEIGSLTSLHNIMIYTRLLQ